MQPNQKPFQLSVKAVVVDGEGPEGIWDAHAFPLPIVPAVVAASAPARPVPTAGLDVLDTRFCAWFAQHLPAR